MSFPDLQLDPECVLHASAVGVPVNGPNTIKLPFRLEIIDPKVLEVHIRALGGSVSWAEAISVVGADLIVDFTQAGNSPARIDAVLRYSASR